jgi:hypothetical protein
VEVVADLRARIAALLDLGARVVAAACKRRRPRHFAVAVLCKNSLAHPRAPSLEQYTMKKLAALALIAFAASVAHAEDSACMAAAKEKKLAGAAQKSFVKKCETDAKAKCELAATEKKLAGAAKNSNVKKCVKETGPAAS